MSLTTKSSLIIFTRRRPAIIHSSLQLVIQKAQMPIVYSTMVDKQGHTFFWIERDKRQTHDFCTFVTAFCLLTWLLKFELQHNNVLQAVGTLSHGWTIFCAKCRPAHLRKVKKGRETTPQFWGAGCLC